MTDRLQRGMIVYFGDKAFCGMYNHQFDLYKGQLFEIVGCANNGFYELLCISDCHIAMPMGIRGDMLIPATDRIHELAISSDLRYNTHQTSQWRVEELQRFAERIIRECALIIHNQTGPRSALRVLEHYGLKEQE